MTWRRSRRGSVAPRFGKGCRRLWGCQRLSCGPPLPPSDEETKKGATRQAVVHPRGVSTWNATPRRAWAPKVEGSTPRPTTKCGRPSRSAPVGTRRTGRTSGCQPEPAIDVTRVSGPQVVPPFVDDEMPRTVSVPLTAVRRRSSDPETRSPTRCRTRSSSCRGRNGSVPETSRQVRSTRARRRSGS
jgi:hypothetical protein